MKTGSDVMTQNLRTRIIQEATDMFMELGFLATSTHQIAKNLGITQPAIYHHFPNKEALYIEVLTTFSSPVEAKLKDLIQYNEVPRDALIEMSVYLTSSHPVNFNVMMNDMNQHLSDEAFQDIFKIYLKTYYQPFLDVFIKMKSNLNEQYTINIIVNHFLRGLSAYIINEPEDFLKVKDYVNFFLEGALKRTV